MERWKDEGIHREWQSMESGDVEWMEKWRDRPKGEWRKAEYGVVDAGRDGRGT